MRGTSVSWSSCPSRTHSGGTGYRSSIDPGRIAEAGADADRRTAAADRFVLLLQTELHAVFAGRAVHVVRAEAALDLALARLEWIAVGVVGRARVVAPLPLDGGAVELLGVVGAAGEVGGDDDADGRHPHGRVRLEGDLRFLVVDGGSGKRHGDRERQRQKLHGPIIIPP